MGGKHDGVRRIDRPSEWLSDHTHVLMNGALYPILTANNFGDIYIGTKQEYFEVNISDDDVTVIDRTTVTEL